MTINIEYEAEKKLNLPYESIIEDVVNASLDYEKCPYEAEVNVILTDNAEIRRIKREFRQIDSPTDVLSFPMGDFAGPSDKTGSSCPGPCTPPLFGDYRPGPVSQPGPLPYNIRPHMVS